MFRHDCSKHGHRYKARYSEEPSGHNISKSNGYAIEDLRTLMYHQVYIHDICTKCGDLKVQPPKGDAK